MMNKLNEKNGVKKEANNYIDLKDVKFSMKEKVAMFLNKKKAGEILSAKGYVKDENGWYYSKEMAEINSIMNNKDIWDIKNHIEDGKDNYNFTTENKKNN